MAEHKKLLLEYEGSTPGKVELESVWALPVASGYQIDNIPFYARSIAFGDIVSAEKDAGGMLRFTSLVKPSHHSTIRLWFSKEREQDVAAVRQNLRDMGCASEISELPRLVAVDIPPTVSYEKIRKFLNDGEKTKLFEYEEACLGFVLPK